MEQEAQIDNLGVHFKDWNISKEIALDMSA